MSAEKSRIQARYDDITQQLLNPNIDQKERHALQRESSYLSSVLQQYEQVEKVQQELSELEETSGADTDDEFQALLEQERETLQESLEQANARLDDLLIPPDPLADRSVFLEIRAGAGGKEAALFAGDLLKMYSQYALAKGWNASVVDVQQTDLGGIREATLHIQGKDVYAHLKHDSGVHRVQRVPKTEASGRIHTSTATVAVLPEAQEVDVQINPSDLRIDTYRAGGAGGQHVNTTDSAVRITHVPTGVVVSCQDERSQHKNKTKAMKMLQSRIMLAQREEEESKQSEQRKEMVGTGMRAEKVRTYNYPQNRVTDHQVNVTLKKLDMVMEGKLDDIIEPLMEKDKQDRKKRIA